MGEIRALAAQGRSIVSLMRGEPDFATPTHIVAAAQEALTRGRTSYPDNRGEPALRQAIARKLARENGLDYDPDTEILVTTGATLGIWTALQAVVEPGEPVWLPDPVYDAYQSPIHLTGAEPAALETWVDEDRFVMAPPPNEGLLLLNTPWNPVGTVFREDEIEELVEPACLVISDEIYEHVTYGDARHVSPARLARDKTIIVQSLSKSYAMTGWRVGFCAAPAAIIDRMLLVLQQVSRGPATFVQDAAVAALDGPQDCVAQMRAEYARRRAMVLDALPDVLAPEGGFFAMVEVGGDSDQLRRRLLNEHGVAVMHGAAYGEGGEGWLRVSFANGAVLEEGLRRLREGLAACR